MASPSVSKDQAPPRARECGAGVAAARIAEALADKNVLAIVSNEYRAKDIFEALKGAAPDATVILFPPSDALPGDAQAPTPANSGERLAALRRARGASKKKPPVRIACITTAEAASEKLPKPASFDAALTRYAVGGRIERDAFRQSVQKIGYFEDDRVDEPAEFAMRGLVIDIFPADSPRPIRIEVGDGVIAAMREYDPVTQRGVKDRQALDLSPAAWPVLQGRSSTLFEHFPDALVAIDPGVDAERARFLGLAADAQRGLKGEAAAAAAEHMVDDKAWKGALAKRKRLELGAGADEKMIRLSDAADSVRAMNKEITAALAQRARVVIAGSAGELKEIQSRLSKKLAKDAKPAQNWIKASNGLLNRVRLLDMRLDHSWREPRRLVVSAAEVLGGAARYGESTSPQADLMLELGDVCIGDVVIHEDHGVAVIAGLVKPTGVSEEGGVSEAIELEYADDARRLIPVEDADRIWKYGADRTAVKLDNLNGATWRKRRLVIDQAMRETAEDMTRLAAEAAKRRSAKIEPDPTAYAEFSAGFPFSETPDQARAIQAVRDDLASGKPMDRLVIGDVGYGKTEVALRAAGLAALAGRQAVIAAPTTVLVRQHFETFKKRFERTGLQVASLSRLSTAAEKKQVKAGLADGTISVVVGTGAVAAEDVTYKDLALVVIDEEQRFGAADKAKLRDLASEGHLLTLTATPIPRTLQTALLGLKQMSVIATPPARRQPIRTLAGTFDEAQVRTALLREKDRGGQSFVVVPQIADLEKLGETLHRLAPDLSLLEAHGEMPAAKIDESMVRFAAGDADILLATNIIEAGLDVPRANTMIVWRADRFGLAQLHQLRGRVGRGNRRGHILLTTEPGAQLTEATRKRLRTLESLDRLGAGFAISARDLDIRGAGDLVGDVQSGHMKLIGIDLYQHLLERAVREARGETVERWTPVINLGVNGRIPPDWIPEADTRLSLYLRLARLTSSEELAEFKDEVSDRFGDAPQEAVILMRIAALRALAREANIAKVDGGPNAIAFTPRGEVGRVPPPGLVERKGRLIAEEAIAKPLDRLARAEALMPKLAAAPEAPLRESKAEPPAPKLQKRARG